MPNTPFDLDAVEAEATASTFEFTLKGQTFHLPAYAGLDYRLSLQASEASGLGEMRGILRAALGDDQWSRFDELPLSIAGLRAIFTHWDAASGTAPGESQASAPSSRRTGKRSRQTSSSTTG